jgi:DNA mismatch endonuclease (patch repair protein)
MDIWSRAKRSEVMSLIRGKGNKETENALLALFRQNKITGWRRHLPLPGRPDFAFPKQKVAVFVDGCFWHGCPKCYSRPKTNRAFWDKKRENNMARDRRVTRQLRRQGWKVIRIWQHALQKSPNTCLNRIRRALELSTNTTRKRP